jgi:AraC-like DNA-binding protein
LLERALLERLARGRPARSAVEHALTELERPGIEVGEICRELSLSRRRFIEIFTEDVGMTPKKYVRVRRFQRALALAGEKPAPHWGALALACGYFDQAHLCRDWLDLTGVSPSRFVALRQSPVKEHHLALPAQGVKSVQDSAGRGT